MDRGALPAGPAEVLRFDRVKAVLAAKIQGGDRSPIGRVDHDIRTVVSALNAHPLYHTTSSCSGRLSLFASGGSTGGGGNTREAAAPEEEADEPAPEPGSTDAPRPRWAPRRRHGPTASAAPSPKGAGKWLFVSHGETPLTPAVLEGCLAACPPTLPSVHLLAEETILHVQAATLPAACALMGVAVAAGFRESGLSIGARGKIIVAIRCASLSLDTPVMLGGTRLFAPDSPEVAAVVALANERFRGIVARRGRLEKGVLELAPPPPVVPPPPAVVAAGGPVCRWCECGFPSKNRLMAHLPCPQDTSTREGKVTA